jgi:hypothetical protein
MEVSSHLQVPPAFPPRKNPSAHRIGNWVGPRARLNGYGEGKFHPVPVFETRNCPARSLVTIPTTLFRLLIVVVIIIIIIIIIHIY